MLDLEGLERMGNEAADLRESIARVSGPVTLGHNNAIERYRSALEDAAKYLLACARECEARRAVKEAERRVNPLSQDYPMVRHLCAERDAADERLKAAIAAVDAHRPASGGEGEGVTK